MKTALIVIILLIGVLVIGFFGLTFLGHKNAPSTTSQTTFPAASTTVNTQTEQSMSIHIQNNQTIAVKNFIGNGTTITDPSNAGNYYLTGFGPGEFTIGYNASRQFFTVSLGQEPIGKARLDAESFLANALGIPKEQLCSLNYFITTTSAVNATFAGKNLGFSFCPGAVQLP